MSRPIESQLYRELVDSRFQFIERGIRHTDEIYEAVYLEFGHLCDNEFKCLHYPSVGIKQPEWNHSVRHALGRASLIYENIAYSGRKGYWVFS
jgi:hypothetical protein